MTAQLPGALYGASGQLPHGRHGLPPEIVADNQRRRLMAALALAVHELGYQGATVNAISARAHVSKSAFYTHFESKDDCFETTYALTARYVVEQVMIACEAGVQSEWPLRVRAALTALVEMFAVDPPLASLVLVGGLCAGRDVCDHYEAALDELAQAFGSGAPRPAPGVAPAALERAVVGGIASILVRQLSAGPESIGAALPGAVEFALTPYLGAPGARRIVSSA